MRFVFDPIPVDCPIISSQFTADFIKGLMEPVSNIPKLARITPPALP
jgi:hypothetical protein